MLNDALYKCSQMGGYLFTQKMKAKNFLPYALHGLNVLTKEGEIRTLRPSDFADEWNIDTLCMPLLLSIDKMFEEIEHEGERIKPIFWIFDKGYKSKKHYFTIPKKSKTESKKLNFTEVKVCVGDDAYRMCVDTIDLHMYPYTVIQNLIELKIDIFGLIDKGAALDFHKITQLPKK